MELLKARVAAADGWFLVLGADRVIDVASEVSGAFEYAKKLQLYQQGLLAERPETMPDEESLTSFTSLLATLREFQREYELEELAAGDQLDAFCMNVDSMSRARYGGFNEFRLPVLDRIVEHTLRFITPEMEAQRVEVALACRLLKDYSTTVRPVLVAALGAQATEQD